MTIKEPPNDYETGSGVWIDYAKAQRARAERAERALCGLTAGGSEFAGDVDACVKYVRDVRMSQHAMIVSLTRKVRKLEQAATDEAAEQEALRRWHAGETPGFSTGICESLTAGYGKLDESGYWEFPLYPGEAFLEIHELRGKLERLEAMRPHWAKGYSSDGIAAQTTCVALNELWSMLGVKSQTDAVAALETLGQKIASYDVIVRDLTAAVRRANKK
jgi:hypothetical protein